MCSYHFQTMLQLKLIIHLLLAHDKFYITKGCHNYHPMCIIVLVSTHNLMHELSALRDSDSDTRACKSRRILSWKTGFASKMNIVFI